jgi:putative adhesin
MSKPRRVVSLVLLVLSVPWAAPASAVEVLEDLVEQKYAVNANATLSVTNADGSIRVYAAEAPEITIQAIKKAYTRERLQGIVVDVKATSGGVAITTSFPPRKNALSDRSGTVDYIIVVPQTARITDLKLTNGEVLIEGLRPGGSATAHLTNGWLVGHNSFVDLDLTVESGRLDVAFDWWENHKFSVEAGSTRGNVRATLPSDASLSLNATAVEGRVANAFEPKKAGAGDVIHSVATVIGSDGEVAISLEAARGNIQIDKTY